MAKTQTELFARQEAIEFLQDSYMIKDVTNRLKTDRKNLADEIVTQILAHVPFQSVLLVSQNPEERKRPSFDEIKEKCKSGDTNS